MSSNRFLAQCEREPLAFSGAIQPHGALVVAKEARITHLSANLAALWPEGAGLQPGDGLPEALGRFAGALPVTPGARLIHAGALEGREGLIDLIFSRAPDGAMACELIPAVLPAPTFNIGPFENEDPVKLAEDLRLLTDAVALAADCPRVMYYRFLDDGDGEVVAETRQGKTFGSYLGLRFPASDIPQIARALYQKNPWRLIADATADPVGLIGAGAPDLTHVDLRSVSPIHRAYLANMGVRAALSFPVVVGDRLDALVSAHHERPLRLDAPLLETLARLVRRHAHALAALRAERRIRLVDGLGYRFQTVKDTIARHGDLVAAWPDVAAWLMSEFEADGACLGVGERILTAGDTFEPAALAVCDAWFVGQNETFVWQGESLSRQIPGYPISQVAGMLAVRAGRQRDAVRLYLTRGEHIHEVAWGGNPDKPVETDAGGLPVAPRRSFEKWIEKRLGYCRPWGNDSRLKAFKLRELLMTR